MIAGRRRDRKASLTLTHALPLAILALLLFASLAHATAWKKYRGEFAGDGSDCIDFDSIKTGAKGLTHFRRYVIDDAKACGRPTQYDSVERIAVSCREVLAAGPNRDGFPVRFFYYDSIDKRGWRQDSNASRQFARVMQYVCQNRK